VGVPVDRPGREGRRGASAALNDTAVHGESLCEPNSPRWKQIRNGSFDRAWEKNRSDTSRDKSLASIRKASLLYAVNCEYKDGRASMSAYVEAFFYLCFSDQQLECFLSFDSIAGKRICLLP
jgi:hypothetical protein